MRLDRALTLSVVRPLRNLVATASHEIPILMYHSVASDLDADRSPYYRTVTSPQTFARQIEFLLASGYVGVSLSDALNALDGTVAAESCDTGKLVALTFDDGFRDFHTQAFPILERAGFGATVFLASAYVGKPFINGRACLSASDVRELDGLGIEFGSHSASHTQLVDLERPALVEELRGSRAAIEDIVGHKVELFSYPYRFPEENRPFTAMLGALLDECGYRAGVTTVIGRSRRQNDRRFLPRLPVNDCDDPLLLQSKLAGDYDWLRSGQRLRKQSSAVWRRWAAR